MHSSRVSAATRRTLAALTGASLAITGALVAGAPALAVPVPAEVSAVDRITGADRFEVAARISAEAYPGGAPIAYVATGLNFPDALSAAPAAGLRGGPLLLTMPDVLPAAIAAELDRLDPERIVVVGGPSSVSTWVEATLHDFAPMVERISGADRYEASIGLVEHAFGTIGADVAYLATGTNFPDALSASAVGASIGAPVILVKGWQDELDGDIIGLLADLGVTDVRIAGGPASVSAGIFAQLRDLGYTVTRLGGQDRFAASLSIAAGGFHTAGRVFFATGYNFPDALAGAAWAGRLNAPLVVLPGACVNQQVLDTVDAFGAERVTLLGGPNSLSPAIEDLSAVCPGRWTPNPDPVVTAAVPAITGEPAPGGTLIAVAGAWGPAPVTLSYVWRVDGMLIPGARGDTFSPTAAEAGHAITVQVSGSRGGSRTSTRTSAPVLVTGTPTPEPTSTTEPTTEPVTIEITTAFPLDGTVGTAYESRLEAEISSGDPISWQLVDGDLPDGLELRADGLVFGTPTVEGVFDFAVRAYDGLGHESTAYLGIHVQPPPVTIEITSTPPNGTVGAPYESRLEAEISSGDPISWSLVGGELPAGLALDPDGLIVGTPTAEGTATFTVQAGDGLATTATATLTITIDPAPVTIEILSAPTGGVVGVEYGVQFRAEVSSGASTTWSRSSGELPPGLVLSTAGWLSGTPTSAGSYPFTLVASDGAGHAAELDVALTIAAQAASWPQFGGGPTHTGASSDVSIALDAVGGLGVDWELPSYVVAMAVDDGVVYLSRRNGGDTTPTVRVEPDETNGVETRLGAFDLATGEQRWEILAPAADGGLAVAGDRLLLFPYAGLGADAVAYSLESRELLWTAGDGAGGASGAGATLLDGDTLVICSSARLRAFALADGALRWEQPTEACLPHGLAAVGGRVVVADAGQRVVAFDLYSGDQEWETPYEGVSTLVASDGVVYADAGERTVALDAATGAEQWSAAVDTASIFAVDADRIYGTATWLEGDEWFTQWYYGVVALDRATGDRLWQSTLPAPTNSGTPYSPRGMTVANGVLWVTNGPSRYSQVSGSHDPGALLAFDAATGGFEREVWRASEMFLPPVVADGRVLAAALDRFAAIGAAGGELPAISPDLPTLAFVERAYTGQLRADGGVPPLAWAADGLPAGLTLDPATGRITGTPAATGSTGFSVTLTDARGLSARRDFTIAVEEQGALRPGSFGNVGARWQVAAPEGGSGGTSAPVLAGGTLYYVAQGSVRAVDAATGDLRWSTPLPNGVAVQSGPGAISADGSTFVLLSATWSALALGYSTADGALRWQVSPTDPALGDPGPGFQWATLETGTPSAFGDLVAFGVSTSLAYWDPHRNAVAALRVSDGTIAWVTATEGPVSTGLASDDTRLYVGATCSLDALDPGTGAAVWSTSLAQVRNTQGPVWPGTGTCDRYGYYYGTYGTTPLVRDGVVYAGLADSFGAFDAETGTAIWQRQGGAPLGEVALVGSALVIPLHRETYFDSFQTLVRYDAATGEYAGQIGESTAGNTGYGHEIGFVRLGELARRGDLWFTLAQSRVLTAFSASGSGTDWSPSDTLGLGRAAGFTTDVTRIYYLGEDGRLTALGKP